MFIVMFNHSQRAVAPPTPARGWGMSSHQRATLIVSCVGFFMVLLDLTIVNTALPTIENDLHATFSGLQWVIDAYTLTFASLLLTGGTLGDRFGRKRLFQGGMALFAVGSLLCGLAQSPTQLDLARGLQGIGAAALAPASLALLATAFPVPRDRIRAVSLYAALSSTALGFGPTVGGALVSGPGWRWVFFVNIPIAALCLGFGVRALRESTNPGARRIDLPGQVLIVGGLAALTYGLIERGSHPWGDAIVWGPLAAAVALIAAFLVVETRVTEPMLPLRLFRTRLFSATALITLAVGFSLISVPFFFVQFLQGVQGMSALSAGIKTLPFTVMVMITAPLAGRLVNRSGFDKPVALGALLGAIGLWSLSRLEPSTPYLDIFWRGILTGAGFGLVLSPLSAAALAAVEPRRAGLASSVANAARQVGSVVSVALLGAVVATREQSSAFTALAGLPHQAREAAAGAIARSGAQPVHAPLAGLSPERARDVSATAYTAGIHSIYLIAAGVLLAAAIAAAAWMRTVPDLG
jgi:DHA2 family methylenomycin A resistance protein-like MFS transporter